MYLIGLDIGTTSVKGIAITPDGSVLGRVERPYPLSLPRAGWSEQDPERWWAAAGEVLAELGANRATSIGLSGQMHGLVVLDRSGRILRPAILWNDGRSGAECAEIEAEVGRDRLLALTGNRAAPGFTAPSLLWLRKHEPDVYRDVARVLLPKDYVRYRLTGDYATDVTDASGTLLFDVGGRRWSEEVLADLRIDPELMPAALESVAEAGQAPGGVPVAAGAADQAAGAVGVGAIAAASGVAVVIGTSGVVLGPVEAYPHSDEGTLHVFCHAVTDTWYKMGVVLSAGKSLQWLAEVHEVSVDRLVTEAAKWEPGAEGLLFAPYLAGERTPHLDPDVRGAFIGLSLRHDRAAMARAVLEGVAFALRDALDLVAVARPPLERIRISGSGTRSRLWLEILASVFGHPLELVIGDGAALGAAQLGGVAAGVWPDVAGAVEATLSPGQIVEPLPQWAEIYEAIRPRFEALYPRLRASSVGTILEQDGRKLPADG